MRKALALLLVITAGGCAMPQTTQELREVYKRDGSSANIDKYAINRPFAVAFADVKANADQCLNVRVNGRHIGRRRLLSGQRDMALLQQEDEREDG